MGEISDEDVEILSNSLQYVQQEQSGLNYE